jgi:hypothetical protein
MYIVKRKAKSSKNMVKCQNKMKTAFLPKHMFRAYITTLFDIYILYTHNFLFFYKKNLPFELIQK